MRACGRGDVKDGRTAAQPDLGARCMIASNEAFRRPGAFVDRGRARRHGLHGHFGSADLHGEGCGCGSFETGSAPAGQAVRRRLFVQVRRAHVRGRARRLQRIRDRAGRRSGHGGNALQAGVFEVFFYKAAGRRAGTAAEVGRLAEAFTSTVAQLSGVAVAPIAAVSSRPLPSEGSACLTED
jgi:hypothetical protein